MASIQEVALKAGVSKSTVSRCINNHPSISQNTKDRVMKIVKELNYVPNVMAKSLSSNNSYNITLLVDDGDPQSFQNPFFYEVMHGIENIIYENKYSLVVANVKHIEKEEDLITWLVKTKRTEGIILPSSLADEDMLKSLKKENIPFVVLGDPDSLKESSSWIDVNNRKGGEQATLRLMDAGYKRISFIGFDETKVFSKQRYEGYQNVVNKYNLESLVRNGSGSKQDGYEITKELLNLPNRPDAIICSNEIMSIGCLRAIQEKNLNVPEDIGIISFDNDQIAELAYPMITTVNIDVYELGVQSAKLLFEIIDKDINSYQQVMISTTIKERETIK